MVAVVLLHCVHHFCLHQQVELGYTVFLCCDDNDVQILYTLDGTQPVQQHHLTKVSSLPRMFYITREASLILPYR